MWNSDKDSKKIAMKKQPLDATLLDKLSSTLSAYLAKPWARTSAFSTSPLIQAAVELTEVSGLFCCWF